MTNKLVAKWIFVGVTLLSIVMSSIAETDNSTTSKTIKETPIVINTIAKHYENPTIGEYELCSRTRTDCLEKCTKGNCNCPICPVLTDQPILIQGINDTYYRLPISTARDNQTNIIRVTNLIHNNIETKMGNITANNQNNVNVYQNLTSRTGGKFGLGYSEKGPCCHTIEAQRCRRSINGPNCSHRSQRTCGAHCISRVMRAKRVVSCSETNPESCVQEVEYLPQPRRPGCQYTSKWPFITCKTAPHRSLGSRRNSCARCYELPYLYFIRGIVPRECLSCYGHSMNYQPRPIYQPYYNQYYPTYSAYPHYNPHSPPSPAYNYNFGGNWAVDYDGADEFEMPGSGGEWKVDDRKCINENGTVIANCTDDALHDGDLATLPSYQPVEINADEDYDTEDGLDYDYGEYDTHYRQDRRRLRTKKVLDEFGRV